MIPESIISYRLKKFINKECVYSFNNVQYKGFEADVLSVDKKHLTHEFEIKSLAAQWKRDLKKFGDTGNKHDLLASGGGANYFTFVLPWCATIDRVVKEIPQKYGILIYSSSYNPWLVQFHAQRKAQVLHSDKFAREDYFKMLHVMCGLQNVQQFNQYEEFQRKISRARYLKQANKLKK